MGRKELAIKVGENLAFPISHVVCFDMCVPSEKCCLCIDCSSMRGDGKGNRKDTASGCFLRRCCSLEAGVPPHVIPSRQAAALGGGGSGRRFCLVWEGGEVPSGVRGQGQGGVAAPGASRWAGKNGHHSCRCFTCNLQIVMICTLSHYDLLHIPRFPVVIGCINCMRG